MTLCRFRPKRTYEEQFMLDKYDVDGLRNVLGRVVHELGEDGDAMTPYYIGALLTLETLFGGAETAEKNEMDIQTEFMRAFEGALDELGED